MNRHIGAKLLSFYSKIDSSGNLKQTILFLQSTETNQECNKFMPRISSSLPFLTLQDLLR